MKQKKGKLIFSSKNLGLEYSSEVPILRNINIEMRFGEKVVLLGRNGSGKTSFVNVITQKLAPTEGEMRIGNDIKMGSIDQLKSLDTSMNPLEHLREHGYEEEQARRILSHCLFTQAEATTAIKILSGGQQQRFKFLLLFKQNPEFIIFDEPTNNLDPSNWELLLNLVNEYSGSLLIISHDRSFVEQLEEKKIWVLKNQTLTESWDDLDQILKNL